jgi:hypothetical protein
MSRAEYMNNFWIRNLQNKLDYCSRNIGNSPENRERVKAIFRLIINELKREQQVNRQVEAGIDLEEVLWQI